MNRTNNDDGVMPQQWIDRSRSGRRPAGGLCLLASTVCQTRDVSNPDLSAAMDAISEKRYGFRPSFHPVEDILSFAQSLLGLGIFGRPSEKSNQPSSFGGCPRVGRNRSETGDGDGVDVW